MKIIQFTLNLVLLGVIASGQTRPSSPQDDKLFSMPMAFSVYYEHSGSASAHYILARGVITKSTPSEFLSFYRGLSKKEDHIPSEIWFHSPGGSINAALEFGKIIRQLRMTTRVG